MVPEVSQKNESAENQHQDDGGSMSEALAELTSRRSAGSDRAGDDGDSDGDSDADYEMSREDNEDEDEDEGEEDLDDEKGADAGHVKLAAGRRVAARGRDSGSDGGGDDGCDGDGDGDRDGDGDGDDDHDDDGDDDHDDDGDDDHDDEEDDEQDEPAADYLDDGTEENDSAAVQVQRPLSIQEFLAWRLLGRVPRGPQTTRSRYAPYEEAVPRALTRGSLWQQLSLATGAVPPPVRNSAARFDSELDACYDSVMLASRRAPYGMNIRQAVREAVVHDPLVAARVTLLGPPRDPAATSLATSAAAAPAGPVPEPTGAPAGPKLPPPLPSPSCAPSTSTSLPPEDYLTGLPCVPAPRLLLRREQGQATAPGSGCGWSGAQMRHLQCCGRALPRYPREVVDRLDSRAYIGQFSADGQFFVAAFQDRRVRLYDVERGWRLRKDITTRMCRWTITDTSISPDQRFVIYSSIIPVVHLVEVGSVYDSVSSICNITQIHEPLNFETNTGGFGIWSVQWSGDGREIVVGNNDTSVVVMDVETKRVVASASGHEDDVNAVTYADSSPNIIISGSDDTTIKVWDRRTLHGPDSSAGGPGGLSRAARPVGILVGHTEGLTHLDARGDGLHVLSNAKDQTAKLWDLRMVQAGGSLRDAASAARLSSAHVPQFNWDYRWQEYPAAGRIVRHPHDTSLQTFRGHTVQSTLIRAYFSPLHSTGQRFVYAGSAEGGVHVYDVMSGQEVEGSPLQLHRKLVRDMSWHPFDPVMATVSWDGTVVRWDALPPPRGSRVLQVPGHDALNDY